MRSIDVAEYLGVTKASVSKAMATLESSGYVEMGKRDVHLTERGLEVARQMWERHCFFVGLLEDAGVSAEVASQEGCHMEHCLSEESFEKLRAMLGREDAAGQQRKPNCPTVARIRAKREPATGTSGPSAKSISDKEPRQQAMPKNHQQRHRRPGPGLVLKTFHTDIFCIEDVDDAPVYH